MRWSEGQIVGFDLGAGLVMAEALGICLKATAELLPIIEAAAMPKIMEKAKEGRG